jgi:D-sedoheptulose 7-phosphate isomerase
VEIAHFGSVKAALDQLDKNALKRLKELVKDCTGIIWIAGNGGSFSTAQHWACDLTKTRGLSAIALGANGALQSAYANDISYADGLPLEFAHLAKDGDLLICLSCSGISPNIHRLIMTAQERQLTSILLTGTISGHVAQADHIVRVWSKDYTVIEDCHLAIGHWLTKELSS